MYFGNNSAPIASAYCAGSSQKTFDPWLSKGGTFGNFHRRKSRKNPLPNFSTEVFSEMVIVFKMLNA